MGRVQVTPDATARSLDRSAHLTRGTHPGPENDRDRWRCRPSPPLFRARPYPTPRNPTAALSGITPNRAPRRAGGKRARLQHGGALDGPEFGGRGSGRLVAESTSALGSPRYLDRHSSLLQRPRFRVNVCGTRGCSRAGTERPCLYCPRLTTGQTYLDLQALLCRREHFCQRPASRSRARR